MLSMVPSSPNPLGFPFFKQGPRSQQLLEQRS